MSNVVATSRSQITGKRIWFRDQYTDREAYAIASSAKTRLLLDHPFWGFMGLDLVLVEMPHDEVPTLCTEGYHIFYSASFIKSLTAGEVVFAFAHEIYHCIFGHTGGDQKVQRGMRKLADGSPNPDFNVDCWGYAIDYVTNNDLKKGNVGEFITTIKILYDEKYDGMSSEEVYADLLENPPPNMPETLDIHIEIEIVPDGDGEDGDAAGDGNGSGSGSGSDDGDGKTLKLRMTASEYAKEKQRWEATARRAIAHVGNSTQHAGSVPEHLRRLIGDMSKPKVDWRAVCRKYLVAIRQTGHSFARPDKRTFGSAITLPSYRRDDHKLTIAVAIDTSGSVNQEALSKFISELLGILKGYRAYEIHAFCFEGDVDPTSYSVIKNSHKGAEHDLRKFVSEHVKGGGGTSFKSVWNFMRQENIKPRGLIFFTDGYPCDTEWESEGRYCPTMFLTVGNNNNWSAPFGTTVQYEDL